MDKYSDIEKIQKDIQNLNIQGATNVCIAVFEGMKAYVQQSKEKGKDLFYKEFLEVGNELSLVRPNEPLAKNGVTFVKYSFGQKYSVLPEVNTMKQELIRLCDEYLDMARQAKRDLVQKSTKFLTNLDKVFTHCHSSTAVELIVSVGKGDKDFEAVCTETRPLFQGRITAKSLLNAGIKTTLIADSAAESFVINRGSVPVEVVFLGCDQITAKGHAVNKIGSWGIAMAAHYADKPCYIVTPLLKIDTDSFREDIKIEVREDSELWEDAPTGLNIFNPAFEIVDKELITGYITEVGIIKPGDVEKIAKEKYPWLLED